MSNLYKEIKKSYYINNLDFDKAVDVWMDNNLSIQDVQTIIHEDCGRTVTANDVEELVRYSSIESFKKTASPQELNAIEMLQTQRVVKLTPAVRNLVFGSTNNFKSRFAKASVEWSIIMIDNVPHLARKDLSTSENKYSNNDGLEREWVGRIKKGKDPFTNIPESEKEKETEDGRDSNKNC